MTAAAATLRDQINADYAARRLRLHHAREVADWERVVIETTALLQLTEHLQEGEEEPHPFVDYLVRSRRIAQAQHEREADTRTEE
jgi:hypothetical protein